jgi:hypothetical protein
MLRSGGAEPGNTGETAPAAAMPQVTLIAPGVAQAVINGVNITVRQDGAIKLEDVLTEYGSPELYLGTMLQSSVLSTTGQDGETLFANGVVGYFSEWLGSLPMAPTEYTLDDHKQLVPFSTQQIGGDEVTVFADGVVTRGQDERNPALAGRDNIPRSTAGSSIIWGDGVVMLD